MKKQAMKQLARMAFRGVQQVTTLGRDASAVTLHMPPAEAHYLPEVRRRFEFFMPEVPWSTVRIMPSLGWQDLRPSTTVLTFGVDKGQSSEVLGKLHGGVFDIDWRTNPQDGWNWIDAASRVAGHAGDLHAARLRYEDVRASLRSRGQDKVYLFGTGPSLERAATRDWNDGIRIVCNTIVRDQALWHHIDPDLLVAGDGIYHFGFTEFAHAFRADLVARLQESPTPFFVYPAQFDIVVRRFMPVDLHHRLIPIPVGLGTDVQHCLRRFELPALGNVLNLLLLPIGCDVARQVGLWGFDGRAPADQLFWANSPKQSYAELLPTLQCAHPAFFDHHVPKNDPEKYLRSVHGDVLENCLRQAEAEGWKFNMLHKSWTPSLATRQLETA